MKAVEKGQATEGAGEKMNKNLDKYVIKEPAELVDIVSKSSLVTYIHLVVSEADPLLVQPVISKDRVQVQPAIIIEAGEFFHVELPHHLLIWHTDFLYINFPAGVVFGLGCVSQILVKEGAGMRQIGP